MNTHILAVTFAFSTMLVVASAAQAEDSNRTSVRASIEDGGWHVAYGRNVTEAEYAQLTATVAVSVSSGNPGPILAYLKDFAAATVDKVTNHVPEISKQLLAEQIKKAIVTRGGSLTIGRVDVKFGIATYNRWERAVVEVPDGVEF